MEAVRESWTDERMDDLSDRVSVGFRRVDDDLRASRTESRTEFAAVRGEMKDEFAAVRGEVKDEFAALRGEMHARFDAMQRLILQVGGGMIAAFMVGILGVVATL